MRILMLLGVLLLAQGCVVHSRPPRRPAPPPPPSRPVAMSYDEAVNLGFNHCRSRGYQCELKDAHRTGNDVWKVKFAAFASGARGHVHLDYHAYSRELLKVNEKVKGRNDHHDDWDDDDDDGRGHGRGKKKGHAKRDD
ncbi:hypothetical protein [Hyalangium rubrum]|uniref:Lipoprotein n=1 Tax=Hyalangium rubrum TaxID=3103134 RepID=A0ABU5H1S2_9BACT|nr:hypothetical protein [Hyalangium sp. s54d21]MDY7227403.1 hypothetical protein [Hyalangium sp. s54d21]